jgi:hypothetical protein
LDGVYQYLWDVFLPIVELFQGKCILDMKVVDRKLGTGDVGGEGRSGYRFDNA